MGSINLNGKIGWYKTQQGKNHFVPFRGEYIPEDMLKWLTVHGGQPSANPKRKWQRFYVKDGFIIRDRHLLSLFLLVYGGLWIKEENFITA